MIPVNGGGDQRQEAAGNEENLRAERAGRAGRRVADPRRGETPARGMAAGGCVEWTHGRSSGGGGETSGEDVVG